MGVPGEVVFVPVTPCRLVDTRTDFSSSPGPLAPGEVKRYFLRDRCGIPGLTEDGGSEVNQARALALNIVAVSPAGFGHLTAWPTNQAMPATSVINYSPGQNIANGVIVPMCDQEIPDADACPTGDISFVAAVSSTHLVVDVTGYYIKSVIPGGRGRYGAGAVCRQLPVHQRGAGSSLRPVLRNGSVCERRGSLPGGDLALRAFPTAACGLQHRPPGHRL